MYGLGRRVFEILSATLLMLSMIGAVVPYAAASFVHPRGLMTSTYPQQPLVFWGTGDITIQFILISVPPWYFVEDLDHYDTVVLTATLRPTILQRGVEPLCMVGGYKDLSGNCVMTFHWTDWIMSQDEYGATMDAYKLFSLTFPIDKNTADGYYLLIMSATATSGDSVFNGWDQIAISVAPGHIPTQPPIPLGED